MGELAVSTVILAVNTQHLSQRSQRFQLHWCYVLHICLQYILLLLILFFGIV